MRDKMKNKELVSRYVDGAVTPDEKIYVEQLLSSDKELNQYYKDLTQLDSLLNERDREECSPDWEQNVITSLDALDNKENKKMKKQTLFKATVGGSVVVTLFIAVISLHVYSQKALQGRVRDGSIYMQKVELASNEELQVRYKSAADDIGEQFSPMSTTFGQPMQVVSVQKVEQKYEPYYLSAEFDKKAGSSTSKSLGYNIKDTERGLRSGVTTNYYSNEAMEIASIDFDRHSTSLFVKERKRDQTQYNTEEYARIYENDFKTVRENPLSTFSIDVDTGSYSNIRRYLNNGQLPPADAVRIEEMINYFSYKYEKPTGDDPFSINIDAALAPWNKEHKIIRVGLQGKTLSAEKIPASNLVYLIDVSGSMSDANKLPLLKKSLKMMVRQLSSEQRVAIVVYAGAAGQVLESTPGSNKQKIYQAIDQLSSGGSTAGGAGIKLAYKIAKENYIKGGNNRVILATDGDFNVGTSSTSEMTRLIEEKRKDGVFLTVLGFGMGNYKDNRLEQIANKGNGTYHYIDNEKEAKKVFVHELGSTLFTIAKDVKIQIEFNPAQVKAYRLIGYENRMLNKEDFNDDTKDAGELGAGHTVTALYEIVPADSQEVHGSVDELTYQKTQKVESNDLMTVKLRYKEPDQDVSKLIKQTIQIDEVLQSPKDDFQFITAVAEFGLVLRQSKYKAQANYEHIIQAANQSRGKDSNGYRAEFIELVKEAQRRDNRADIVDDEDETPGVLMFKGEE